MTRLSLYAQAGGIILPSDCLTVASIQHFLHYESFLQLDQSGGLEMLGGHQVRQAVWPGYVNTDWDCPVVCQTLVSDGLTVPQQRGGGAH